MSDEPVVIVLCTFPADGDAAAFGRTLVDERLAACVNVLPAMQSIYRWEGSVAEAAEHQLLLKTTAAHVDAVITRIAELHPYTVPEILVLPIGGGGAAYLDWVRTSVSAR